MKCPGIDSRYLKAEVVKCSACGYKVEIFSDEIRTKCPKCKKDVYRKKLPSCLDWCRYASKCLDEGFRDKLKKGKK